MAYLFFQVVGLEKPADLRRARAALAESRGPDVTYWVDPLDQVAWLERPGGEPFGQAETARIAAGLSRAGFWVVPIDQSAAPGPACIARHRRRRLQTIRRRLGWAALAAAPVVLLHALGGRLVGADGPLWPVWLQLLLTTAAFGIAATSWFYHGARSLLHRRWRWRTGTAAVLAGCYALAAIDLLARQLGGSGLATAGQPHRSLFAPAVLVLALALLRAVLLRWRIARISEPFDRWLANMTPDDESLLRFFLRTQARHQRSGLDLSWGRLADRFTDAGLALAALALPLIWVLTGRLLTAWLVTAGLLLILDPRLFQLTWMAPEVLAERQGLARGIFFSNPRVFQLAAELTTVVFDKTGSLTTGPAELDGVQLNPLAALDLDAPQLLRLAASVEQDSPHALAAALLAAAERQGLDLAPVADRSVQPGMGVAGHVDGRSVLVGSERFLQTHGLDPAPVEPAIAQLKRQGCSVVLVAVDGQIAGAIGAHDVLRAGAERAVADLAADGLAVRLVTGDSAAAGAAVAASLGISQAAVELSPQGKLDQIAQAHKLGERIATVVPAGKDQPLLEAGDVGIALCGPADTEPAGGPDSPGAAQAGRESADAAPGGPPDPDTPGSAGPARRRRPADAGAQLGRADVLILRSRVDLVPTALRLARQVGLQRSRGLAWTSSLVAACALAALFLPLLPPLAEWSPAVVAALTLAGLPVALGRSTVHADS